MVDIQVGGGHRVMADASHAGAGRTFPVLAEHRLDLVFLGVGQLESAACEELDAVIRHRIVGGGDHRAHLHVEHAGQVGHARGRDDARIDHVEPSGAHAGRQRGGQEVAGHAGVAADQRTPPTLRTIILRTGIPQHAHRGVAQIERQLRGQVAVRQSSYTIGSKHLGHELRLSSAMAASRRTPHDYRDHRTHPAARCAGTIPQIAPFHRIW